MNLQKLSTEARFELARQKPGWNISVCVRQGMTYSVGSFNGDDPNVAQIQLSFPPSIQRDEDILPAMKVQLAARVAEREDQIRKTPQLLRR